ncbi:MAG: 4-hydroxybenzoate octaprenyltransferase [Rhodospirillaceae bacterium]|nr:4-hydroxybenzoate octaprenyltransferase [Rhodospirillaceae bacterium]
MNDIDRSAGTPPLRRQGERSPDWIDRYVPQKLWPRFVRLRPYFQLARVEKPIGFLLLMWPCWWGVALAEPGFGESFRLLFLFAVGSFVMRAAGCAYNDIVDRDIDAQVARTRTRPLASGALTVRQAVLFMVGASLIGLLVLLQLGRPAIVVGLSSLILVAIYPFMKRVTYWPQAFLGLAFNWGPLVAWAASTGRIEMPALILYAAGIAWTLGYDTIYAHQDKEDDVLVGVKSSALKLGNKTRPWLIVFYLLAASGLCAAALAAGHAPMALLLLLPAFVYAGRLIWRVDLDDPASCLRAFKANNGFAFLVFAAFLLAR